MSCQRDWAGMTITYLGLVDSGDWGGRCASESAVRPVSSRMVPEPEDDVKSFQVFVSRLQAFLCLPRLLRPRGFFLGITQPPSPQTARAGARAAPSPSRGGTGRRGAGCGSI